MKIVRYLAEHGAPSWGCVIDQQIRELIGDPISECEVSRNVRSLSGVRLLAPCQPRKIIAMAINYPGATGLTDEMTEPLVFLKAGTSVCGPADDIVNPFPKTNVWGESELAIVIGRDQKIFGYTAANDVSADNIFNWDHHLARSKSADTFCPLGPWIDTEYSPANRWIEGYQNGDLIRRGNSNQRLFQDDRAVAWLSTWMTLEPWDIILTGAPPRVVPRRYLQNGDEFVVRIDGLGELRNRCRVK